MHSFLGVSNSSVESSMQNGIHSMHQLLSQTHQNTTKNSHRKSLDKGEKQEDQHNRHNAEKLLQTDKTEKKFSHTNGTSISSNDLQFIEKIK